MAVSVHSSLLAGFASISMSLFLLISSTQIHPYMDEIFHVPQAQKYCENKFDEWDSMITTLPGLYLISVATLRPLMWLMKQEAFIVCNVLWLRMINLLFAVGNVWLIYKIMEKLNKHSTSESNKTPDEDKTRQSLQQFITALILGTFPVLYFFTFLYYTDAGSTFFVLLMYAASLYNHHYVAMVAGFWAIMFRQTNIIWIIFTAGSTATRHLQPIISQQLGNKPENIFNVLPLFVIEIFKRLRTMIILLFPYVLLVIGFVVFVLVNGSIVVGDKSHHQACFNFPQVLYFSGFSLFFISPHLLTMSFFSELCDQIKSLIKPLRMLALVCIITVIMIMIHNFTYVHQYLLADNRHYPFYVWNKIFQRHWSVKFLLTPVYILAVLSIQFLLQKNSLLWRFIYSVCVILVLTPQNLLEFRYFIVPYVMLRVHMQRASYPILVLELLLYSTVNAFTIWMFVKKPFYWADSKVPQRFMW